MQKGRVMLRAAGGIPYELTRGRVKRLNLHVRRDGTVALSIPLRTTLEAADAYVIAEAEWIRAAQARQAAREKRQEKLPAKIIPTALMPVHLPLSMFRHFPVLHPGNLLWMLRH